VRAERGCPPPITAVIVIGLSVLSVYCALSYESVIVLFGRPPVRPLFLLRSIRRCVHRAFHCHIARARVCLRCAHARNIKPTKVQTLFCAASTAAARARLSCALAAERSTRTCAARAHARCSGAPLESDRFEGCQIKCAHLCECAHRGYCGIARSRALPAL
jgi:hypothetical protein